MTLNRTRGLSPFSAKKLAELQEAGMRPSSTFTRRPYAALDVKPRAKRQRDTGPDANTRDAVLERDMHRCVVCGFGLLGTRGVDWSIHHRLRRSQGLDNSAPNLISACGNGTQGCHGAIHARPKWAREFGGWLLRSTDDPATFPVLVERGTRWVLLLNDGSAATTPSPENESEAA